MQTRILNICLHDVVTSTSDVKTIYDMTRQQVEGISKLLQKLRSEQVIDSYHIFFDDGYSSALNVVQSVDFGVSNESVHLAIITDDIGKSSKLTEEDIILLTEKGFVIDSHGASHSALAIFVEDTLQASPVGGNYDNTPRGKANVLSIQEIKYQFIESSKCITSLTGHRPASFVLPYGLYNEEVIYQAADSRYQRIYSCDSALDSGQFLAPRLLVTQENINNLETLIKKLPSHPELLA